jgi:acyl dehydratase
MADLNVGDAVPELRVTPDKYLPHRYAGASGDFNPIHIDDEFANMASTRWAWWRRPTPPSPTAIHGR